MKKSSSIPAIIVGILFFCGCFALLAIGTVNLLNDVKVCPEVEVVTDTVFSQTDTIYEVYATYYNAVSEQCDASPLHTADGSKIDLEKLRTGELRWIAVSQEMLKRRGGPFNFGDTLYIYHEDSSLAGPWVIHDCMGKKSRRAVDLLLDVSVKHVPLARNILISKKPFYTPRPKKQQ